MNTDGDRANTAYWDDLWSGTTIPRPVDPLNTGFWYHIHREFHRFHANAFAQMHMHTSGKKLLEIGSARSVWLPYFARTFGFDVVGIDYSEVGAEQSRYLLTLQGLEPNVVCADFRAPPQWMLGAFDVVTSYGVMEHFADTAEALQYASALLKPGGLLLTVVPNMSGTIGWLQKAWNRPVYDIHVAVDRNQLIRAHERANLGVLQCEYAVVLPFGVVNLHGLPPTRRTRAKQILHYWLQVLSGVLWLLDERLLHISPNALVAGYVLCAAHANRRGKD